MWGPILGSIAGAALGGIFGRDANEDNRASSEAFAQHGVRWRVADAKAAGLHPLFALGASAPMAPTAQPIMTAAEGAAMGQNIGRAVEASNDEARLRAAQLSLLEAQRKKTDMETLQIASETSRLAQSMNQSQPAPFLPAGVVAQSYPVDLQGTSTTYGGTLVADPSRGPNSYYREMERSQSLPPLPHPGAPYLSNPRGDAAVSLRRWAFPGIPGGEVILPDASNFAEALESLENPINQAAVGYANSVHYGKSVLDWLSGHLRRLPNEKWAGGAARAIHKWSIK